MSSAANAAVFVVPVVLSSMACEVAPDGGDAPSRLSEIEPRSVPGRLPGGGSDRSEPAPSREPSDDPCEEVSSGKDCWAYVRWGGACVLVQPTDGSACDPGYACEEGECQLGFCEPLGPSVWTAPLALPGPADAVEVVALADRTFGVFARLAPVAGGPKTAVLAARVDRFGVPTDLSATMLVADSDTSFSALALDDGGSLVAYTRSMGGVPTVALSRRDAGLDVVWGRSFGDVASGFASAVVPSDGAFVVAATRRDPVTGEGDARLVRSGLDDEAADDLTWPVAGDQEVADLLAAGGPSGPDLLVVGTTRVGGGPRSLWVISIEQDDASTWLVWNPEDGSPAGGGSDVSPGSARFDGDGGLLVAGAIGGESWLARFDSAASLTWSRTFGPGLLRAVASLSEGPIALGIGGAGGGLRVLALDASGEVRWERDEGPAVSASRRLLVVPPLDTLASAAVSPDGGLRVVRTVSEPEVPCP